MSLGEDYDILAVEDLRWLPRQRKRGVRCSPTCWNPDVTEKRRPALTSCAQDEVVEVVFALSHHEAVKIAETPATALAALARQETGRSTCKHAHSSGTRRVSQSEAKRNQQFPQTCSGGGGYEVWIALQELDENALGHNEKARRLAEGSLGDTGIH